MLQLHQGDCREVMRRLIDQGVQVHTCITSPPYFGLRDYGTAEWVGGDPACSHIDAVASNAKNRLSCGHGNDIRDRIGTAPPHTERATVQYRSVCRKCGAVREDRQIGLERTPACRRVAEPGALELRPDLSSDELAYVVGELIRLGLM